MQIHDINDYYRPRRFPWLPVALLAALVVAAIVHFSSKKGDPAEETAASEPAAEAPAAGAPNAPATPGVAPVAPSPLPPAAQPAGPALSKAEADAAIAKARQLEAAGQIEGARDQLLSILDRVPESARAAVQEAVGRLSIALFVSPCPAKGKVVYVVKSGDSLSKIAAKFNCPVLLIEKANGIQDAAKIRAGLTLVFPDHPAFSVLVSKSRNTLAVLLDGKLFKHYAVGTGAQARTPAGTFKVVDKISEPPWWPGDGTPVVRYGDPKNILGTHWLALEATGDTPRVRGYGIHGTWDESTIGRQSSAGCVRMRNADVAEVFMLLPRGTPVTIVE
ncbi:MAG: L,D-transpeptidase family protein [Kiritimatiellae bacterium]|nr:L,D-transpeptidase family protein [Kiritimatiellia bacterium]